MTKGQSRVLSLAVGDRRISIDAGKVTEVIRRPVISRVPNGPPSLVGLCSLRGLPLPVIDMRGLLGLEKISGFPGDRVVVYSQTEPVGLLVDEVFTLSDSTMVDGISDLEESLSSLFLTPGSDGRKQPQRKTETREESGASETSRPFLAFSAGGQTFGITLEVVEQVVTSSSRQIRPTGDVGGAIGLTTFRERVLPVVSLAVLVGLRSDRAHADQKIVVIADGDGMVGLVVERVEAILRLPASAIDPVPPLLTRSAGSAELEGVGRYNGGASLVAILSPKKLFGNAIVEAALSVEHGKPEEQVLESLASDAQEKFLLFGLGDETYGIPLEAIEEIIQLPEAVTRVPNAPDFILGVSNLRGRALALIDQRARFGTASRPARPRAIVVTVDGLQAGFVVDTVNEIVLVPKSDVSSSPDFSSEATAVFDRVAHIKIDDRMILLVDPKQLLSASERDLVLSVAARKHTAKDS